MKAKDLRERSLEDLKELEKSLSGDTFQNRFKNFTNRLDDTSQINKTRRDLARVKTLVKQMSAGATPVANVGTPKPTAKAEKAAASAPASKTAKPSKPASEKAATKPSTKTKAAAKSEAK